MPSVKASGTELYYERAGEGEPMLMIQGMSATHLAWGRPLLDELEQSFDCIVFDNRGMGNSGRAEVPFTIADLAADTLGLLDALELDTAHVVGISMGGMIAQELALADPERIRTLTIGASYCGGPEGRLMAPEDLEMLGTAYVSGDPEKVFRAMWEINLSSSFREDDSRFAAFTEMGSALPAPQPVVLQQMRACGAHNTYERLGQISHPTLVLHGNADRLLDYANGREIAAAIPNSRLETLDGVGHMFWWEAPQRTAELIREHVLTPV
jgi:pimeloyl-ACP methyl ester carboxylesterase